MKLNPFRPNLDEEHTSKTNKIGQPAEGHMSLLEHWPHITSILLLEIKTTQNQGINMDTNGMKIQLFALTGSQGRARTSPGYLQARGRMCPGQVKHRRVNRRSIIPAPIQGQLPIQTLGEHANSTLAPRGFQTETLLQRGDRTLARSPNDISIRNQNYNKGYSINSI